MKPKCSCKKHEEFCTDVTFQSFKISAKKFRKCVVHALINEGLLTKKSTYLCTTCASFSENNLVKPIDENQKLFNSVHANEICFMLKNNSVPKENLLELATSLGNTISQQILSDCINCKEQYKDDHFLKTYDPKLWLERQNEVLVSFLRALCFSNTETAHSSQILALVKAIEHIYLAACVNVTLPLSFMSSLMTYFMTGSKNAIQLQAATSPSGTYNSILNWLKSYTAIPVKCPSEPDIFTFFDNNQVLARNWRVRYYAKAKISVITNMIHIIPAVTSNIQQNPHLSPFRWLHNSNKIIENLNFVIEQSFQTFEKYRLSFISSRIENLKREHGDNLTDEIDVELQNAKRQKNALESSAFYDHHDPYIIVKSSCNAKPNVMLGNPVFVNPCSYDAVEKVLHCIQSETLSGSRKWTIVGCDGSPYILASRLIANVFLCPECEQRIYGPENLTKHLLTHRKKMAIESLSEFQKFGNILLQPGLGHIEINMTKACFKLLWDVCLKDLAKLLGFRSPKAQAACQSASDHHKSMQIIEIMLFGTSSELLLPYYRQCIKSGRQMSASDYLHWAKEIKNSNYIFMHRVVFSCLFALYLFRAGVRRNNSSVVTSSRVALSPLFYGLNMTHYQELDLLDMKMRVQAPNLVRDFIETFESFSTSGHESKGEGGDFVLEAKNRRCKMWMPPGVPSEDNWLRVCRNFDRLEEIRDNLDTIFQMVENDRDMFHPNTTVETKKWRTELRQSGYLSSANESTIHKSFSGEDLDDELVFFLEKCRDNKNQYYEKYICGQQKPKLSPVFVMKSDRTKFYDLTRKTKAELQDLIMKSLDKVEELLGVQKASKFKATWEATKAGTKASFVSLYKEICNAIDKNYNENEEENDFEDDNEYDCQ